jgi:signal transduction protein with GAF and PtsI domain
MNRYEKFCSVLVLTFGFGVGVVAVGQTTKVPVLGESDKVAILQAQKQALLIQNQISNLQNQYQQLSTQQTQVAKTMNDLVQKAEHEHPGYKLNLDTLEFAEPPKPQEPKKP